MKAIHATTFFSVLLRVVTGMAAVCVYLAGSPTSVHCACSIASVQNHNFGTYVWGSAVQLTGSSTITVTCDTPDQIILALDGGLNPTCFRNMAGPDTDALNYTLTKSSSSDTDLWGDSSSFWLRDFSASAGDNVFTVYGWTKGHPAEAGHYQDTVTVRLLRMSDNAVVDTASLAVGMDVASSCYIDLVQTMSFGSFPADVAADRTTTGSIEFRCTPGVPYQIGLDPGLYSTAPLERRMLYDDPTPDYLPYGIYQDSGYSMPWGSIGSPNMFSGTGGPGGTNTVSIFGLVEGAATNVRPGFYGDTVAVTVQW